MSENTPQRIGDYEIIRELGHGGMGKVYLARNVLSDRMEAMKVILPDLAGRSEFVARFMREIKTLASLDHPNIAALRTAFTAGDQFVMIMEYVEGISLADRLGQGRIPTADALNYIEQVLSALSYAHARQVIHRDIKPGNMMLTPQGMVKLMDFGLARSLDEVGLTVTGATLGSLDYASPEQVQSFPTDERSDLYSVGVSLYQMVTHQRMFSVTSSFAVMQAQVKEIPRPPIAIVPDLPQALNDIIMKAIAKNPAERFQTADEFHQALSRIDLAKSEEPLVAAEAATIQLPSIAPVAPADLGFNVASSRGSASPINRSLLLVVGVILVAAFLAGDAVYKSHQQKLREQAVTAPVVAEPPSPAKTPAPAQTVAASATSTPAQPPDTPATPVPPPAPGEMTQSTASSANPRAHSKRATADNLPPAPANSDADIQAQQQAALEHKQMLDAMETELDQLHGRASSVESSLGTLEQEMHRSGLGLRGDMVAARSNMRNDLDKAAQALNSGDTERARHFIDLAHREMEKLEAFLGHR